MKFKIYVGMLLFFFLFIFFAPIIAFSATNYVPSKALKYIPVIKTDSSRLMPGFNYPYYFGALIEHESCISLTHKRCWEPTSELKTSRELGIGLGQLTKAYKTDGTVRFDSLSEMRNRYYYELKELSWNNIKQRPDLQIRALILMIKTNYNYLTKVTSDIQRLKMTDAAYNGGLGGINKERIACGLAKNCNPQFWDNNVELYCLKSKKVLYGQRSACDINRAHVFLTFKNMEKYKQYFN